MGHEDVKRKDIVVKKVKDYLSNVGIDERIILKYILEMLVQAF
jgi:hypothetical protein